MEDSKFRRSLEEVRIAGSHLRSAGGLLVGAVRESASAPFARSGVKETLARAWDSRVLLVVRRRIEQWRSRLSARPELVRISLKEQAQVIDSLAKRLSASRDELEELSRLVERLEERFETVAKPRAA